MWRGNESNMMQYDPKIHHRRSIRLKGYDYSQAGAYFITICCHDKECRFGIIEDCVSYADSQIELNEYGTIAYNKWLKLPERFSNFDLDVFQIMPNHIHGIIILTEPVTNAGTVGARFTRAPYNADDFDNRTRVNRVPTVDATIGDIVGAYKSLVANACLEIYKSKNEIMGKFWQRNYHEHIIRNEQSYQTISDYIINNPAKWNDDKFFMK